MKDFDSYVKEEMMKKGGNSDLDHFVEYLDYYFNFEEEINKCLQDYFKRLNEIVKVFLGFYKEF